MTTVPLKRLATIRVSNVDKKSVEGDVPVRLCNYTDVYYRDEIAPHQEFMAATASPDQVKAFRLRRDDVVITKDSETAEDIGVPTYVRAAAPDLVCGYHLAILRPNRSKLDGRFLYWFMSSTSAREQLAVAATGVTRFGLRADSTGGVLITSWPLGRQRAIADYLETETARVDGLISKRRAIYGLLEERASLWLNQPFGSSFDFNTDGVPIGVPGFEMARLGYLARVQTGVTLDAGREVSRDRRPVAYLRVANVQDGHLDLRQVKNVAIPAELERRCLLRAGDVLMTEGGDPDKLGRGAVWQAEVAPCVHQNHVFAVRPDASRLLPEFLALVTRTAYARRYFEVTCSKTTGIASTSASKIAAFRVPLPSLEDQRRIVGQYRDRIRAADRLKQRLESQVALLREHRQALVTAAVTGELEIPGAA